MLTPALIAEHQLPPHEPKSQDSRTPAFIERYGVACVEVDALPPDVLADVVETAIRTCVEDPAHWAAEEERDEYERLLMEDNIRRYGPALDTLALAGTEEP